MCQAAQYVAQDLLRDAGFTDVAYVTKRNPTAIGPALASGEADINLHFAGPLLTQIDAGDPVVVLAGAHIGCFELFGTDRMQAIRDLKGKPVAVPALGSPPHIFLASMLAQVGLDPATDVRWETHPPPEAMQLLDDGRVDGYLGFPTSYAPHSMPSSASPTRCWGASSDRSMTNRSNISRTSALPGGISWR
jgi:NitT/TauT family transport system substrate-binding protein